MDLSGIKVEPILDYFDREYAEDLLSRHHPLGARKLKGHRLVYGVMYRGRWVGVLTFDQCVYRNKHREGRIGWSDGQRKERLRHVVNNSRYLILPEYSGEPNLASKVLSLATSRLSLDWERQYGYPILAVETYVNPERRNNQGTCYVAAGWENLGLSSGYERPGEERTTGKWYFLKALHPDSYSALRAEIPHALITGIKPVRGASNNNYVLDASKFDLKGLKAALAKIPDHRSRHGRRYEFLPLLSLCVAAVLSGYTQYRQITDWISKLPGGLRVRFGLPGDVTPSESTITKFLSRIDPEQLQSALSEWLLETYGKEIDGLVLSMDGKAIRATGADAGKQVKFLNVLANDLGIVIEQKPTKGGSGENITAQKVVQDNELLQNATVIADAIHTEKKFITALEKKTVRISSLSKIIRAG
jgi:hypothetical protein